MDLNELAKDTYCSELEDVAIIDRFALNNLPINERFVFNHADDIITPITQHLTPLTRGQDGLRMFRLTSLASPQATGDVMTQSEIHRQTFSKRKWIQPASPPEQDLVGCNQRETPPLKKFTFGLFMLPTNNCHPASGEECKIIDIGDRLNGNGQNWLTEKDNSDSASEGISKEDRTAFIELQLSNRRCISDVEKTKCEVLETSHYWEESRNHELSIPMENSPDAKRCESISVFKCHQDTTYRSDEMDSIREKVDNGTERIDIAMFRTSK